MNERVLIVDDDPVVRHILSTILETNGFVVHAAESGAACLRMLAELKAKASLPNLMFMDMNLLDTTGIALFHDVRNLPYAAEIPIVFLSANSKADIQGIEDVTPAAYLEKPFVADTVLSVIGKILQR